MIHYLSVASFWIGTQHRNRTKALFCVRFFIEFFFCTFLISFDFWFFSIYFSEHFFFFDCWIFQTLSEINNNWKTKQMFAWMCHIYRCLGWWKTMKRPKELVCHDPHCIIITCAIVMSTNWMQWMQPALENWFVPCSRAYARVDWAQEVIQSIIIMEYVWSLDQVWLQQAMKSRKPQVMLKHIQQL